MTSLFILGSSSDGAPHTVSLVNPIQSAQEVGPKFTTKARFGFQILLNYTGGALIFIRREQLCWKLKQDASVPNFKYTLSFACWTRVFCPRYASRIRIIQNSDLAARQSE